MFVGYTLHSIILVVVSVQTAVKITTRIMERRKYINDYT
jgi:hypothetical protein